MVSIEPPGVPRKMRKIEKFLLAALIVNTAVILQETLFVPRRVYPFLDAIMILGTAS